MIRFALPFVGILVALSGCAVADEDDAAGDVQSDVIAGKPKELLFSVDQRPVDGALTEIKLARTSGGMYDATFHTQAVSRMAPPHAIDHVKDLASNLRCTFAAAKVECSRDDRPVDGALHALTFRRGQDGKWDATLHTSIYDRRTGKPVDTTDELAFGLARK